MIFTLYYMYATVLQCWRLCSLRNKLNGTLNTKNALLLSNSKTIHSTKKQRCIENLLFHIEDRIACTIVPKQNINLSHWVLFPKNPQTFPIYIEFERCSVKPPFTYVIIRSVLENYSKHDSEAVQVENFGELIAWKAVSKFEILLKTDLENLTKLVHCYWNSSIDINHDLQLLELETVNIDGNANKIKYDRKYSIGEVLKYSHSPNNWKKFVTEIRELYLKIRENSNPKIKIENGTTSSKTEERKVPIFEVKPIKKESKKITEDKNTLEVTTSEHRRHKITEKRDKSSEDKHKKPKQDDSKHKEQKTETKVEIKSEPTTSNENPPKPREKPPRSKTTTKRDRNEEHPKTTKEIQTSHEIQPKNNVMLEPTPNIEEKPKETNNFPKLKKRESKIISKVKPPNILVYSDSLSDKENVKTVLNSVINDEKYIVYDFPSNTSPSSSTPSWNDSTVLVVICGATTPELTSQLLHYLVNGGQLLCLCSDLLHSILSVFSTAEVREHELVRFSYGEWKNVKMMHHIFCYQASPAKKQFSKDSVESNHSNGSSPIAPRTPSIAEIQHNGKNYTLQIQVLGTEETWQTPSLLLAKVKNSKGIAIFSQVHLEIDPLQYEDDENKFAALKESNQARLEILTDILKNRLDIDCNRNSSSISYTPAYFLGRHEMKMELFKECKEIVNNTLNCDYVNLVFCGKNVDPGIASATRLPVMLFLCPSSFSTVEYFSTLNTDMIGRLVIYVDVIKSTQHVLNRTIKHGLVVIARQQTKGVGRSNNTWLSPLGSACFSLQLHIPLSSPLGRTISLVQQLIIVAIVEAIKKTPGYEKLNVGIKWPNDIYVNRAIKIGGLMVTSSIGNRTAVLNIGCGFNLNNTEPTISLNGYIEQYNKENETNLEKFTHEKFFATIFNEIENLYDIVQNDNVEHFYETYYKHWIHQDANVKITSEDGKTMNAVIKGIDDFGYLKVKLENGETTVVRPDGNTFDMIKGLIAPKCLHK